MGFDWSTWGYCLVLLTGLDFRGLPGSWTHNVPACADAFQPSLPDPCNGVGSSAFGQGVSYTLATLMVFLVGIFREVTGGWELTLWLLFAVAAGSSIAGIQLAKHSFVDDELS